MTADPFDAYLAGKLGKPVETVTAALDADETEGIRREMIESGQPQQDLATDDGQTWTADDLQRDFSVIGFSAPFVVVRRKSDGKTGTLEFTHSPRVYFGFEEAT